LDDLPEMGYLAQRLMAVEKVERPQKLINWAGNAQNLAIAGAAWIVANFLRQQRRQRD
jgi:hypothetical protein